MIGLTNNSKGGTVILNDKWASLANALHLTPDSVQYREMRKAFYAGALVVMSALNRAGADGVSEEDGARILETIELELSVWNTIVQAQADEARKQMAERAKRTEMN